MSGKASIIIVSYYTGAALWVCLYRALQLQGVHEIIVVNNGNSGGVESHLQRIVKDYPNIRYITGQGNIGFARACNLGAQQATGKYVVFLNPDAILMEEDALPRLDALFNQPGQHPPVGLAGGVLRNDDGSEQRASRRNLLTPANALMEGLRLKKNVNLEHTPLPERPEAIPAISGAFMVMERERFAMLGGFDERYFLHVEDMDLCMRVHKAGGGVWIRPDVNILHYRSTSKVRALFVERMKAKGFHRYFRTHFYNQWLPRLAAHAAVMANLSAQIILSFFQERQPDPLLTDSLGLRRVQAIVRGAEAGFSAPPILPPGSTVLVTGASSAVGLFAIGRLLAQNCKVIALKHKTYVGFFHPDLTWMEGELTDPQSLAAALRLIRCDYALHCAPIWHADILVPLLPATGIRKIVSISSTSVLGKEKSENPKERAVVKKLLAGEAALAHHAQAAGLEWTILRPTMIYGAGLDQNITRIAAKIDATRAFYVQAPATGKRAPVHADDLALASIYAFANSQTQGKTYAISGGTACTYREMVQRVADCMKVPVAIKNIPGLAQLCGLLHPFIPKHVPHPAVALRMQQDLIFADDRLEAELGFSPRPFLAGGLEDIGVCEEERCRSLLPARQVS